MGKTDPTLLALSLSLDWFKLICISLVWGADPPNPYTDGFKNRHRTPFRPSGPMRFGPGVLVGKVRMRRKWVLSVRCDQQGGSPEWLPAAKLEHLPVNGPSTEEAEPETERRNPDSLGACKPGSNLA